jgi:hypothetical protein
MSFKTNSGNFYTKKNFQQLVVKRAARCPIWAPGAQFWAPGAQLGTGPPYIQRSYKTQELIIFLRSAPFFYEKTAPPLKDPPTQNMYPCEQRKLHFPT